MLYFSFFLTLHSLMRGLYVFSVHLFQVLGKKPELREGYDDDDMIADITNRKMAKLYMVSSLWGSSAVFTGPEVVGRPVLEGALCYI